MKTLDEYVIELENKIAELEYINIELSEENKYLKEYIECLEKTVGEFYSDFVYLIDQFSSNFVDLLKKYRNLYY